MVDLGKLFGCKRKVKVPEEIVVCTCETAVKSKWRAYCAKCNVSYLAVVIDYAVDGSHTSKFTFTENAELNKKLTSYIETLASDGEVKGKEVPYIKEYYNLEYNKILLKIFVNE